MNDTSGSSAHGAETAASAEGEQAVARAEQLVDQAGERVGRLVADIGQRLRVLGARAREEAEDIWAEAQSMREREDT